MTTTVPRKPVLGLALLALSAWIRRQGWLSIVYRRLPAALRLRVSSTLAAPVNNALRFKRNQRWLRSNWPQSVTAAMKASPSSVDWPGAPGVNIHAYVRGQFGLAEGARLYARALIDSNYPTCIRDLDIALPHSLGDTSLDNWIDVTSQYPIDIVFVNPDLFESAQKLIQLNDPVDRYRIGCWFWELEKFPDNWRSALAKVDEVMVSSEFVARSVRAATDKPVFCIPMPVDAVVGSGLVRSDFGIDEAAFVFLCTFDFNSFIARKNPQGVIAAFRRAFGDRAERVQLIIKSSNGYRFPERLVALLKAIDGDPRIIVRDEVIDREHIHALQSCCDAYVSLHRAEGFGLGMAECMRLGKPVIATAYSGNLEFMNESNSLLVDYRLVPVRADEYPYASDQMWADPNIDHAAQLMRRLVDEPVLAASIGTNAQTHMLENFSPAVCAQAIAARLDRIARNCSRPVGNGRQSA